MNIGTDNKSIVLSFFPATTSGYPEGADSIPTDSTTFCWRDHVVNAPARATKTPARFLLARSCGDRT
jgi:hypothetical protein